MSWRFCLSAYCGIDDTKPASCCALEAELDEQTSLKRPHSKPWMALLAPAKRTYEWGVEIDQCTGTSHEVFTGQSTLPA